jgi:DNA-binding XRE family transcriptional regulator
MRKIAKLNMAEAAGALDLSITTLSDIENDKYAKPAIPREPTPAQIAELVSAMTLGGWPATGDEQLRAMRAWEWFADNYSTAPTLPTEAELVEAIEKGRSDWIVARASDLTESTYCACAVLDLLKSKDAQAERTTVPPVCHDCGRLATCFGRYEAMESSKYSCDECCGHGNEDGHCEPVPVKVTRNPQPAPRPFVPSPPTADAASALLAWDAQDGEYYRRSCERELLECLACDIAQAAGNEGWQR